MSSPSFTMPSRDLTLTPDEIHVWLAVLDRSASGCCRFWRTLSPEERNRAERFHHQTDRMRFIARHGILRAILGSYLDSQAGDLSFCCGKNGKPSLGENAGEGPVRFSLSHSCGTALFAFTRNDEVGVDIEQIRPIPEMEGIVERTFSRREKTLFRALPREERTEAFYRSWTRKEALAKAVGVGLSQPFSEFDVTPEYPPACPGGGPGWSVHSIIPAPGYAGAVAIQKQSFMVRYFEWPAADGKGPVSHRDQRIGREHYALT